MNRPRSRSFVPIYLNTEVHEPDDRLPAPYMLNPHTFASPRHQRAQQIWGDDPIYLTSHYHDILPYKHQSISPAVGNTLSNPPTIAGVDQHPVVTHRPWWNRIPPSDLTGKLYSPNFQHSLYYSSSPKRNDFDQTGYGHGNEDYAYLDRQVASPFIDDKSKGLSIYDGKPLNPHLWRIKSEYEEKAPVSGPARYARLPIPKSDIYSLRPRNLKMKTNHLIRSETQSVTDGDQQLSSPSTNIKSLGVNRVADPPHILSQSHGVVLFLFFSLGLLSCFVCFLIVEFCRRRRKKPSIRRPYWSMSTTVPTSFRDFHRLDSVSNGQSWPFSKRIFSGGNHVGDLEETKALCHDLAL